jgi:uncharacterized protein (TIGR03437 family)
MFPSLRTLLNPVAFVFLTAGCTLSGQIQSGITVAGFGYQTPASTITAAPGQVLTVSVFGIPPGITTVFPVGSPTGLPTTVQGISVNFVQGPLTVQLPIRGVQQTACPSSSSTVPSPLPLGGGACSPATTLTIQIPYELEPESATLGTLGISSGGSVVATVVIHGVTDSVHVINTCDQTGIYLSLAYAVPAGVCAPMVMHAEGPLVSAASPATAGETLILWAYGLGALNHPVPASCCSSPDQIPLAAQPLTIGFSYYDPGRFPLRPLAQSVPSYAGTSGSGVYEVVFAVPAAPPDLSPCSSIYGNLRLLLSGPSSSDTAEVCLQ